jgi:tol-pal system protein YbgF
MKQHPARLFAALLFALPLAATPASAADKQHLQMMAEIRLLQEQQQQLQQLVGALQDTLKALNTKLDDQAATNRKAMADETLAVNNIGDNVRVLKEKTDETNVRISSVSQEIDALRQSIASQPAPQSAQLQPSTPGGGAPSGGGVTAGAPYPAPSTGGGAPAAPPPGVSAQRMYESAFDDYTAGRWDLAIQGFQTFVGQFPRAPQAPDAQYNIGQSFYQQSKWPDARDAYLKVINDYAQIAQPSTLADANYKLGMTYERLNNVDAAKQAYQTVVQKYPSTFSATQAANALQRINRK